MTALNRSLWKVPTMITDVFVFVTGGGHLLIRRLQFLHACCQSVLFSDADEPDSCSSLPAPRCQQGTVHTHTLKHIMLNHAHFTEYINHLCPFLDSKKGTMLCRNTHIFTAAEMLNS